MSARDELAKLLFVTDNHDAKDPDHEWEMTTRHNPNFSEAYFVMADAILAAGYRRPRTITTAEELAALGHGSVIRSEHRHYWVAHKEDGMGADQGWAAAGGSALTSRDLTSWLPATVLHEPGQP